MDKPSPQIDRGLERLDGYRVERVLATKPGFTTELAHRSLPDGGTEYVVLKHIAREFDNPELWERYRMIRNPHLPRLLDMVELLDECVVVLEYLAGESLAAYVEHHGPLDLSTVRSIADDLCEAAGALAAVGIVHRDIKPSNVILSFGGASLIDPGIARVSDDPVDPAEGGQDTVVLGSWGYAAPEQLGFAQTDARSDVFSLGRVMGFMVTGLSPNDPAYPQALRDPARVPEGLQRVITRACTLEPSVRPANAGALRRLVDQAIAPSGGPTAPGSRPATAKPGPPIPGRARSARPGAGNGGISGKARPAEPDRGDKVPADDAEGGASPSPNPVDLLVAPEDVPAPRAPEPRTEFSGGDPVPLSPPSTTFGDLPGGRKAAVVATGIFFGLFGVLFCAAGLSLGPSENAPAWGYGLFGISLGVFGCFLPGFEIIQAILRQRRYRRSANPVGDCIIHILIWWAIGFGCLVLVVVIARMTGWPPSAT